MFEFITNAITFLKDLFVTPISDKVVDIINLIPNASELLHGHAFITAVIYTFIPYKYIITCITMQIPFLMLNATIKLALRGKSLIPTMGG